jgi:hypothetical protein
VKSGAFDGGSILVTANGWTGTSIEDWALETRRRYELTGGDPTGEHPDFPRADWRDEVAAGDTQLGYWDWVVARLHEPCVREQPDLTNCGTGPVHHDPH